MAFLAKIKSIRQCLRRGGGAKGGGVTNPHEKSGYGDGSAEKYGKHGIFRQRGQNWQKLD